MNIKNHHTTAKELLLLSGMLVLLCSAVFNKFILGYSLYLFKDVGSDTVSMFYPAYINISEILRAQTIPGWSFEQGLGQDVFPFSLSDPTTYLLYLMGSNSLSYGLIWVELLKLVGSGLLFFCFLKKLKLDTNAAYVGGLLYAFSGFMIVGGSWYTFSTLGLYTALILLAFEMLYTEKKWWLFPVGVALIAAYNLVSLYTCCMFLSAYILFRVFSEEEVDFRQLLPLFRNMILLGTLGVLISAVFSLPGLLQMIESPRVAGDASLVGGLAAAPAFQSGNHHYLVTLLLRTFSSDMLGNGSAYKGWGNYLEGPLNYCGLISLLLIPQLFFVLKGRQKVLLVSLVSIFLFAEIFPWFRQLFWLFQGDYFRDFSLYFSAVLILAAMMVLDRIYQGQKVHVLALGGSLIVMLALIYFPYDLNFLNRRGEVVKWSAVVDSATQIKVALFLLVIAANLYLFNFSRSRKYAQVCVLVITIAELAGLSYDPVNKRDVVTAEEAHKKVGYNDYSIEAIAFIKQQDRDFYRIEKNYGSSPAVYGSLNDAQAQRFFGSSSYASFNQLNYIGFLSTCDVLDPRVEKETRWVVGVKKAPLLQILTGVRYLLFKGDWRTIPSLAGIYTEIGKFNDVTILKSRYALPMGVAYDSFITQSDFVKLDSGRKHIALLKAIMVPDHLATDLPFMTRISAGDLPAGEYSMDELAKDTDKLKAGGLDINRYSNQEISGEIKANTRQLVLFSFPFDRGWKASVNGNETEIMMVDGGLSAVLVEPGNNTISLRHFPRFVKEGFYISLLGLLVFGILVFKSRE